MKLVSDRRKQLLTPDEVADAMNKEYEEEQRREILNHKLKGKKPEPIIIPEPIVLPTNLDNERFIIIPGTDYTIDIEQSNNNLNYQDTHLALAQSNLEMPEPNIFMKHFLNVIDCYKNNRPLITASGNQLSREKIENLYNKLTSNCWTWLNAQFQEQNNQMYMINHEVKDKKLTERSRQLLEDHINEDCYVDLVFNNQGLPIKKSTNQNFIKGNNIYFLKPVNSREARFDASSDDGGFSCDRNPSNSNPALGVFSCAKIFNQDFWTIPLNQNKKIIQIDLLKTLLDNKTSRTQEQWSEYTRNNEFGVASMPLYHALFKSLYQGNHPNKEEIRLFLKKSIRNNYLQTLTRIEYNPKPKDKVIHNYRLNSQYQVLENIIGPDRNITKDDSFALKALIEDDKINEINKVYKWLNETDTYLLRVNSRPFIKDVREAGFSAYSGGVSFGCNRNPSSSYPALGVRAREKI